MRIDRFWIALAFLGCVVPAMAVDNWMVVGDMPALHDSYSRSTALNDGNGLVIGSNSASFTADLFDSKTLAWSSLPTPPANTQAFGLCKLRNGSVLFGGGAVIPAGSMTSACFIYVPSLRAWRATGSLAQVQTFNGQGFFVRSDGTVLSLGGGFPPGMRAPAEIFDPVNEIWTTLAAIPPIDFVDVVQMGDGRFLCLGSPSMSNQLVYTVFDPAADAYSAPQPMPTTAAHGFQAVALADGRVLFTGGQSSSGFDSSTCLLWTGGGGWTTTASLPSARSFHSAARLLDGRVLVFGGSPATSFSLLYDPADETWSNAHGQHELAAFSQFAVCLKDGSVLAGPSASSPVHSELFGRATLETDGRNFFNDVHPCGVAANSGILIMLAAFAFKRRSGAAHYDV